MCERDDLARWARTGLTRRGFGAGALAGAAMACAPVEGDMAERGGAEVQRRDVSFRTPDGTLDGEFYFLASQAHPGVVLWPDIAGIRPAKREMARRLAAAGYAVLLANPYYRDVAGQQFEDFPSFAGSGGFQKVQPWRGRFTTQTKQIDNRACAQWLMTQAEVDGDRGIGVQGYCMTGSHAVVAPGADEHIHAGASFHGGGLVTDNASSPHRTLREDAHYLIAIAQNDDEEDPDAKTALRQAADAVNTTAEIEVYPADHGWCVLDSPAYDEVQAERAWARLLALYADAL
ncbi:dienelactone hydrolase family protein [Qipengyuania sp. XHP0207]|uniref:dienelactone hydrolase family protein n=1 Tax=Qipengyuania sp. XHP0207 TaxID=3038078 RepID=UPI00241DCA65|nr:dienelactone hydrolase family protein [Qipengyuania sp. XHP0207]MDG5748370.1 dienelactone hydrolase family protein [Qipengyuania sp. XHP0207]